MASGGWNTIESDAGVFTFLLDNLGVRGVQFEELLALDSTFLSQLSPVYGVIFLFKYPIGEKPPPSGTPHDGQYDYQAATDLFFAAQTIQNACGTQALLSVLLNQDGQADIDVGATLREFKDFTAGFPPEFRGEALSNSEVVRDVHNSFARSSPFVDETQRSADDEGEDVFHFIAYSAVNGILYELDGLQPAPIAHGACAFDEFADKVIPVLERRIARYPTGEIRFNLLAMVRDLRIGAQAIGDREGLLREERKRMEWRFENALRRHNFVGFAAEVLKGVVRGLVEGEGEGGKVEGVGKGDGAFEKWVADAKDVTKLRAEEGRKKKGGGVGEGEAGDVQMVG